MELRKIKGFADILPPESILYNRIEETAKKVFALYMYQNIRVPIMEYTTLFTRGIGISTDIVQKEMFTMVDRKGRSITLRPEATAGIARAYIESGIAGIVKAYTIGPMFRYERPQKGRMRQFHQINCECIGSDSPVLDAEMITMLMHYIRELGIEDVSLFLNTLGCTACRPQYKKALIAYIEDTCREDLCETCQERLYTNPLRILDCKVPQCVAATQNIPTITEYICSECSEHFAVVQSMLRVFGISYTLEPRLVRGLDYYIRTTFEVVSNHIGAQSSLAGGGRYDGLIHTLGGKDVSAVGFACGVERLVLLMDTPTIPRVAYYIAPLCDEALVCAHAMATTLRSLGVVAECAYEVQSIKQALRYAGKHAQYCVLLGEDEIRNSMYSVKNLHTGVQEQYDKDTFIAFVQQSFHGMLE